MKHNKKTSRFKFLINSKIRTYFLLLHFCDDDDRRNENENIQVNVKKLQNKNIL